MSNPILVTQLSQDAPLPTWLDQQDLESLLRQEIPEFRKIESVRCKWEVQLAQPSLCAHLQVSLAGNKKRQVSYLIKSPESVSIGLKVPIKGDFSVEQYMHETVLPALEELYANAEKIIHFSSPIIKSKQKSIYLDYILNKGYSVANSLKGLSVTATQGILSKLAAYHAGTACYIEKNSGKIRELPKLGEHLKLGEEAAKLKSLYQMRFHESLRANDVREYEDKVKSFQKYVKSNSKVLDSKASFNVILNGSCWPNNFLIQVDAFGNVKDALFSDFHTATYGPAAYDLFSLLLTAPAEKSSRFDSYVKYYHDQLIENLILLKFQGSKPSLTDLQLDFLKYGHWAFEFATEILPIMLSDFGSNDIDELFKNPIFGVQIRELLPWLENRGYFEED
ncbi:LOW QUALITY PROTEIN: uncharacterized protein LOC108116298 [Drosophila eugracilis]|uniref:LOW QUALITY PROTEIN: uncharacterized protein LOC108116298 n=1 Tax=Drosophila eugracilis TaxID=29029 RepID=UPI001BDB386E|nr:LOW QUALITY PROTEIN: uncharacterized protein LOC108116298 [Drosophila eugracilis]